MRWALARERLAAARHATGRGLPLLAADERRLSQVLFNLVGNAIRFTGRGEVEGVGGFDCQRLVVAVRDAGRGVDSADQARIFEEFQRAAGAGGPGWRRPGTRHRAPRRRGAWGASCGSNRPPAPAPRSRSRYPSRRRARRPRRRHSGARP
ncbi:MAG: HAMP domain-containing histidine kinase [Betaproteobacteria bacterium]|nr:HAMP domain-containing histidine kinase [Betaproteobacteria bacterium]